MADDALNGEELTPEQRLTNRLEVLEDDIEHILVKVRNGQEYSELKTDVDLTANQLRTDIQNLTNLELRCNLMVRLVEQTSKLDATINARSMSGTSSTPQKIVVDYAPSKKSGIKLKGGTLPIFDGDIMAYRNWRQMFDNAVHTNPDFENIDRVTQLQMYVTQKVKDIFGELDYTAENYPLLLDKLEDEYNKPEKLKQAYYAKLDNLKHSTTAAGHRTNLNIIRSIAVNLASIGGNLDQDILKLKILSCFSTDLITYVCEELRLKKPENPITFALERLTDRINILEDVQIVLDYRKRLTEKSNDKSSSSKKDTSKASNVAPENSNESNVGTASALLGASSNPTTPNKNKKRKKQNQGGQPRPTPPQITKQTPFVRPTPQQQPPPLMSRQPYVPQGTPQQNLPPTGNLPAGQLKPCVFCAKPNHAGMDCFANTDWQGRKTFLLQNGRCSWCAELSHRIKDCPRKADICSYCNTGGHSKLLCQPLLDNLAARAKGRFRARTGKSNYFDVFSDNVNSFVYTAPETQSDEVFLETFICRMYVGTSNTSVLVRGLFDSGASASYIDEKLAKFIQPNKKGNKIKTKVGTFGSNDSKILISDEIQTSLVSVDDSASRNVVLRTTPQITSSEIVTSPYFELVKNRFQDRDRSLFADNSIFELNKEPIKLLIGNDQMYKFFPEDQIRLNDFGPFLRLSLFGWIPTGPLDVGTETNFESSRYLPKSVLISSKIDSINEDEKSFRYELDKLNVNLEKLWELDSIGIKSTEFTNVDDYMLENFNQTTYISNSRYVVRWPWKDARPHITTNFRMCVARLRSLLEKSSLDLLQKYDDLLFEQLQSGIIEYAPIATPFLTHYLPHRGILRKDKLRIVYDASAKTKTGKSLNDLLYRGPMILENLNGLLLFFRLHEIGITADIEKAFLQMVLHEVDRDAVRFLWVKDINLPPTLDNLIFLRFARVPFGVISSPTLLNLVIKHLLSATNDPINASWLSKVRDKFYVDNFVTSIEDVKSASDIFYKLQAKFLSVSMNLREWTSNSLPFLKRHNLELYSASSPPVSVLGIDWNREKDSLLIKKPSIDLPLITVSKRSALSYAASVYDPLGLINPCILKLRLFIQACWKENFSWDESLTPGLVARFTKIVSELDNLDKFSIPRRYFNFNLTGAKFYLHVFCDASKDAYACAAYLCFEKDSNKGSRLCFSKMRIKPAEKKSKKEPIKNCEVQLDEETTFTLKVPTKNLESSLSIPKMELLALVLGMRTAVFLKNNFRIDFESTTLWTDSTIVLQWLSNDETKPKFVENRIKEIKKVPNLEIRHVPGSDNPADIATRGTTPSSLFNDDLWQLGPSWLCHKKMWPSTPESTNIVRTAMLVTVPVKYSGVLTDEFEKDRAKMTWTHIVEDFREIIETTAQLDHSSDRKLFDSTEKALIRELQFKYFAEDMKLLENNIQPSNELDLAIDEDGIIRCTGRLQHVELDWETIHPIYLPRRSPLVIALVLETHVRNFHIGTSHLMAKIREKFWIPRLRSLANITIQRCTDCRRSDGGSYQLPKAPALPPVRVQHSGPFTHIGVDMFGPLLVSAEKCQHLTNRVLIKVYVIIFTCLVTRAVHLEMVKDQSGDEFLNALRRFAARRQCPKTIISDNGKNFVFAAPIVGKVEPKIDKPVKEYVVTNKIKWEFIPAYSPWKGGAYERLIGVVKNCLRRTYLITRLTKDNFATILVEIENTVNSRPLTYVPSNEVRFCLTPNHFLKPLCDNANEIVEINRDKIQSTKPSLRGTYDLIYKAHKAFWTIFQNEYLLSLREKHAALNKPPNKSVTFEPHVNDVVIVKDSNAKRNTWPVGIITHVDRSTAHVFLKEKKKTIIRSINLLYPIELSDPYELETKQGPFPKQYLKTKLYKKGQNIPPPIPTRNVRPRINQRRRQSHR